MNCESVISAAIDRSSCSNPMYGGYKPLGYIANKSDIASYTMTAGVVTAITMAEGKKLYRIYTPTKTPFDGTTTEFAEGDVTNKVNKTVAFAVLDDGSDVVTKVIDPILNGEFVVITEGKWQNDDKESFEIVGLQNGAKCTGLTKSRNDADGVWKVTLQEQNAPSAAIFVLSTDRATTASMLEALC